ncbi:iron response transcriptional regulator IrrA [Brucella gallinifaecis]|uniref:Ferric uptake regulation protein n=1 Tax=Brucella gallinifaecis TaxID=215590 RepID=A0A502BT95_9HYPH|nr:Fur family transcriptional regulator [Brucella gallinifaecis]TPF76223.1 transcriptional repressor [Brucella gallinifaecis]
MLFNPDAGPKASPLLSKSSPNSGKQKALAVRAILRRVGLRPTRQRIALGSLLFTEKHRHVTPDMLNEEALLQGVKLSVATVYNTLNQFADAGLIRKISIHGERTYFDTDTGDHAHFYISDQEQIIDIAPGDIGVGPLPAPPKGYKISKVDILIHLVADTQPS